MTDDLKADLLHLVEYARGQNTKQLWQDIHDLREGKVWPHAWPGDKESLQLALFSLQSLGHLVADCREVLPTLRAQADIIVTSPQYNLGNTSGGWFPPLGHYDPMSGYKSRGGGGKWRKASMDGGLAHGYGDGDDDNLPHAEYVELQQEIIRQCWLTIRSRGAIYYNHKPRIINGECITPLAYLPPELLSHVRQIVIWARAGGINFSPAFYLPTHEWIVIIATHDFRLKSKEASGEGDVWRITQDSNTEHPAPFPVEIPLKVIETTEQEVYCDPHMGSGTVGVACVQTGRKFLGIERNSGHFWKAVERIDAELHRHPLLDAKPPTQRSFA